MATKKKEELTKFVKGMLAGEVKRFKTIIEKYFPNGKDKKDILKKFEEIAAIVEKTVA